MIFTTTLVRLSLLMVLLVACAAPTPIPPTASNTPFPPTATLTLLPPTPTPTATSTDTETPVPPTDTDTPTPIPPTATFTNTPLPLPTNTKAPATVAVQPTAVPSTVTVVSGSEPKILSVSVVSNAPRTMVVDIQIVNLAPGVSYGLVSYADASENCPVHCRQFGKAQSGVTYIFQADGDTSVQRLNVEIDNLLCENASPFTTDRLTVDIRLVVFGYPLLDKATFPATNTWCG